MRTRILTGIFLAMLASSAATAETLDPDNTDDRFLIWAKMMCDIKPGNTAIWWWQGKMYSRRSGEKDQHLFNVQGMNIRQCDYKEDNVRGPGIRIVSREVLLYLDPETNEILKTWDNPFTGETVDVLHVHNDPVNTSSFLWARDENGEPGGIGQDLWVFDDMILDGGGAARLFYKNPLGGEYQKYIGGTYHAMELGSFSANREQAVDPNSTTVSDIMLSWGRISNWLPWMKMGDREGVVVFNTAGMRLSEWDDMPAILRDEIEKNYPIYRSPPPVDDDRPNETSWIVFKRHIDAQE